METSKIKSVQANGTYNSKYDNAVMYTYEIQLENGQVGEVACKSENRWSVGDEVEFTANQTTFGVKLKLSKPNSNYSNNGSYGGGKPDIQARIDASWSIGQAIAILGALPQGVSIEKWLQDVSEVSDMLLATRNTKL